MFTSKYTWQVRERTQKLSEDIKKEYKLNHLETTLLENRGYHSTEKVDEILAPSEYNWQYMPNINEAAQVIQKHLDNDSRILIYGDYDADGITSTTILYDALKAQNETVFYFIPNRMEHGYGPNYDFFEFEVVGNVDLVITVDNGVAAAKEIALLRENDIDAVIIDHHEFADEIPDAVIVHAGFPDSKYPFQHLAGVGAAYKVLQALGLDKDEYLGLVAIGTVADIVSMTDENKYLVTRGLVELNQRMPLGLSTLLKMSNHSGSIDEETIGFTIAPRLNATGRMDEASIGVELLMADDENRAYEIASAIEELNTERKALVETIYKEAAEQVDENNEINIVTGDDWHQGVLGIVASRLVDEFGKPAVVMSNDFDVYKGSARSIEGIDLLGMLKKFPDYYNTLGGHAQALGLSVYEDSIEEFKKTVTGHFNELALNLKPVQYVDYKVTNDNLTLKEFERIRRLKPFGKDFNTPVFMITNQTVKSIRQVGKDLSHIKITLQELDIDIIGFKFGFLHNEVQSGDKISLIGTLNINDFNHKRTLQMVLMDARIDDLQIIDMRSKNEQDFSLIKQDDLFLINEDTNDKENYFKYGEALPIAVNTLVLRDIPYDLEELKTSLKGLQASKIFVIFNDRNELFFEGLPSKQLIEQTDELIMNAEDGAIDLTIHAPHLAKRIGTSMRNLKIIIDILADLSRIRLESGIVYKDEVQSVINIENSQYLKRLTTKIEAEAKLKMSSGQNMKDYLRTLITT
ncbi:Single-stranded-DNA-specific exonuclease RecJ [Jeotgalicoccus saudimassiliensis]|uniref:Single-stranded-DNA-specific exonuclease RecJ n=1 Tax=Jeotgalicoccus saudimassiliensis TaxID=1461582 RepID=A0A078M0Y2_9STAP|nr:single-stranded-DNA-specific exonuclease RecJ [Jeotgalicoccus saudimassiliensis]CDZ99845.1 Single-stranded-DNA-specific exonuclease RecJ [Jeotgalicoccus saudimassiliensis]